MTTDPDLNIQEMSSAARARIAYLSFLNLHFVTLVDKEFTQRLRDSGLVSVLEAMQDDFSGNEDIFNGAELMQDYLEATQAMDLDQLTQDLGVDRTRLYRGVAKGYGPPPPNEMVWSQEVTDFGVLQTLAGIYRAAGLETSPEAKERLDYIGIEIGFVVELTTRETQAWQAGDQETALGLLESQRNFMRDHLCAWVPLFIEEAFSHVKTDFYRGHLLMLRGYLQSELERMEQAVG